MWFAALAVVLLAVVPVLALASAERFQPGEQEPTQRPEWIIDQFVTFYAWPDNDPPGNLIAYPKSRHPEVVHEFAGGTGTYDDPLTMATDPAVWPIGTRMYVPYLQKYVMMEDWCEGCVRHWQEVPPRYHIDIWMNSDANSGNTLLQCQYHWTRMSAPIEIAPPRGRRVEPRPLFDTTTNRCLEQVGGPEPTLAPSPTVAGRPGPGSPPGPRR